MPSTKMKTATDWNGVRSRANHTMTESTPMIAVSAQLTVSPSRVNDEMTEKIPLTKSHAAN